MGNKRRIGVFVVVLFVLMVSVSGFFLASSSRNAKTNNNPGSEQSPLVISNTASLSNILLDKQYNAVYFAMSAFIQDRINPDIKNASLTSSVKTQPDGLLVFSVRTGQPKIVSFDVHLDRSAFDKILMTIPTYSFSQSLKVY